MPRNLIARATIVQRLEAQLRAESFPRLIMSVIVSIAGGAAFLSSAATLWAGVDSMALRYGLAAVVGYLAFGSLIGGWLAWRRRWIDHALDVPIPDVDFRAGGGAGGGGGSGPSVFTGGRSGGGGASASFAPEPYAAPVAVESNAGPPLPVLGSSSNESDGLLSTVADADDERIWLVVLAAVLALGALVAVAYVVYSAPILLAEVALDAGVMSGVYRSVRRHDDAHWLGTVWRRTWLPALVLIVCVTGAGYALQLAAPEARSIGGVIRALSSEPIER